jgi:hypothetical protein
VKGLTLAARRTAIVFAIIASLYLANALLTPVFIGPAKLEAFCRPRFDDTFDGALWKASGFVSEGRSGHYTSSYGTRYRMVDDLLKSHLHIGSDSSKVTDSLGPPDAGTVDRDSLLASPDPYGGDEADPAREILESSEDITICSHFGGNLIRLFEPQAVTFLGNSVVS